MAGAISSMVALAPFVGNQWKELSAWLAILSIAGLSGGITGGLLAIDKYIRDKGK